jgi:hypothetical protein
MQQLDDEMARNTVGTDARRQDLQDLVRAWIEAYSHPAGSVADVLCDRHDGATTALRYEDARGNRQTFTFADLACVLGPLRLRPARPGGSQGRSGGDPAAQRPRAGHHDPRPLAPGRRPNAPLHGVRPAGDRLPREQERGARDPDRCGQSRQARWDGTTRQHDAPRCALVRLVLQAATALCLVEEVHVGLIDHTGALHRLA